MRPGRRHLPLLAAALLPGAARAQARWQMATPYAEGSYHTRNIREFLEEVQQATAGRLQVQAHINGSLLPMPQIKRGVQQGQVQLGEILLSAYANEDPFFDVDAVPQLVTGFAEARKLHRLANPYVQARFARQGLEVLFCVPWPPAGFYTNAPLASVEAFRGMKMRTFNTMTQRFAQLVGAVPTLVQLAEVAQAFATGVVNTMVTSAAGGVDTSAWDYARIFTPVGFSMTKTAIFVQRRALEALPEADRQAVREAAARAEARGYRLAEAATGATEAKLAERGMRIEQPSRRCSPAWPR
ncbi:TRAP transporter substrate-binding protein [Siccirubricoccus phaeus]|uniref:TRAP transporter substrate-binding protein n=1 Tax=Siccirubricoccus phaeus TaxID=2595053 RepID=UPI001F46E95B|nr:TRAP transporter substrate-binding protein [Siccirubricoccus phaeus]